MPSINWSNVRVIKLGTNSQGKRWARVFEKHQTLTYNEYWFVDPNGYHFMGVNEPPDDGETTRHATGAAAEAIVDSWLGG
jgi:hypothetical protein